MNTIWLFLIVCHVASVFASNVTKCDPSYFENKPAKFTWTNSYKYQQWRSYETPGKVLSFTILDGGVKHLCKPFYTTKKLEEMLLSKIDLEFIEPGYFSDINVIEVNLEGNKLTSITSGVFNGTKITSLILKDNKIESIEPGALDNMSKLQAISLDGNKLKQWDSDWFTGSKMLYEVSIRDNFLSELPANLTKNMVAKHEVPGYYFMGSLTFDNNSITDISSEAFSNLNEFGEISLKHNMIARIDNKTFAGFDIIYALRLDYNKIVCFPWRTLLSFAPVQNIYLAGNDLVNNTECLQRVVQFFEKNSHRAHF